MTNDPCPMSAPTPPVFDRRTNDEHTEPRQWHLVDVTAPPQRLAALRIVVGAFTTGYLLIRLPVFLGLRGRSAAEFEPVGILAALGSPLPDRAILTIILATVVAGVAFTLGAWFRATGPAFAAGMLALATYRGSWGQLLHFENLMVLHLLVVGLSPAADAWSLDVVRRRRKRAVASESTRYGWPIALAALVTVVTYVIAGVAKLRYGGLAWVVDDTLRNHIAYSAARLDVLGEGQAPLARFAVSHPWMLHPVAAGSIVIELAAPVALLGGRIRNAWVAAAWLMHASILATMWIGFPSPLFGVAFAPFFPLERVGAWIQRRLRR